MSSLPNFSRTLLIGQPETCTNNRSFLEGIVLCQKQEFRKAKKCFKNHLLQNGYSQDICQMLSYCDFKSIEKCSFNVGDLSDVKEMSKLRPDSHFKSNSIPSILKDSCQKLNYQNDFSSLSNQSKNIGSTRSAQKMQKSPINQIITRPAETFSSLAYADRSSNSAFFEDKQANHLQLKHLIIHYTRLKSILEKIDIKVSSIEKKVKLVNDLEEKLKIKYLKILLNLSNYCKQVYEVVPQENLQNFSNKHVSETTFKNLSVPKEPTLFNRKFYSTKDHLINCPRLSVKRKLDFAETPRSRKVYHVFATQDEAQITSNYHCASAESFGAGNDNNQSLGLRSGSNSFIDRNIFGLLFKYANILKLFGSIFNVAVRFDYKHKREITLCLDFYCPSFSDVINFGYKSPLVILNIESSLKNQASLCIKNSTYFINSDGSFYCPGVKFENSQNTILKNCESTEIVSSYQIFNQPSTIYDFLVSNLVPAVPATPENCSCLQYYPDAEANLSPSFRVSLSKSSMIPFNVSSNKNCSPETSLHYLLDSHEGTFSFNNFFSNAQFSQSFGDVNSSLSYISTHPVPLNANYGYSENSRDTKDNTVLDQLMPLNISSNIYECSYQAFSCKTPSQLVHSTLSLLPNLKTNHLTILSDSHSDVLYHRINLISKYFMFVKYLPKYPGMSNSFYVDYRYFTNPDLKRLYRFGQYIKFSNSKVYQVLPFLFLRSYQLHTNPVIKYFNRNLSFLERSQRCNCSNATNLSLVYPFCNCVLMNSLCADWYNYCLFTGPVQMRFVNFPNYIKTLRSYYNSNNEWHQKFLLSASCMRNYQ